MLRPLCALLLLQGMSLAVGLWIHDRFVVSASQWPMPSRQAGDAPRALGAPHATAPAPDSSALRAAAGEAARLRSAMPVASLIAFGWTFGLQALIGYFVLAWMEKEHQRLRTKSDEQSLQHTRDLLRTRDAVIFGLAKLAESRDPETGHHLERISLYSTRLAAALSRRPKYRDVVTPAFVRLIGISSALHDIGKVAISDSVLLKAGALTPAERFRMQLHVEVGADSIREIERRLGSSNFLEMARQIASSHHERWDGSGYPDGLSGEQIPLAARIVAIADVYDALSVRRVYKDEIPHEECVATIRSEAGHHFDPELVDVFLEVEPQFQEIFRRFADATSGEAETSSSSEATQLAYASLTREALAEAFAACEESSAYLEPVVGGV